MEQENTVIEITPMPGRLLPEEHKKVASWFTQLGQATGMMLDNPRIRSSGYEDLLLAVLAASKEVINVPINQPEKEAQP